MLYYITIDIMTLSNTQCIHMYVTSIAL